MIDENEYKTKDLPLTAYLLCFKHKIVRVEGTNPCFFIISPKPDEEVVNKFFTGKARVIAFDYSQKIKMVKGLMYNKG